MLETAEAVLAGGAAILQYRAKHDDDAVKAADAAALRALCVRFNRPLIINDSPELALRCQAAGVHLGEDDADPGATRRLLGEDALIGVSCYDSRSRAEDALAAGADYVAFGAFFPSRSKLTPRRANVDLLRWARQAEATSVAIGGIRLDNASPLIEAGATMLAVIDALWNAPRPGEAARAFRDLFIPSPPFTSSE